MRGAELQKTACVDYDVTSLKYAEELLLSSNKTNQSEFIKSNGLRFISPVKNIEKFGLLTTIYSPGLFDYVGDAPLSKLINGLYHSLASGGQLIASFLDKSKYDTFDCHWLTKWNSLIQRGQNEALHVLTTAGIPMNRISVERDGSEIGMFFIATK